MATAKAFGLEVPPMLLARRRRSGLIDASQPRIYPLVSISASVLDARCARVIFSRPSRCPGQTEPLSEAMLKGLRSRCIRSRSRP
jgi:hypothetical protein